MRMIRGLALAMATVITVFPVVALAELYIEGENGLVFGYFAHKKYCHMDGTKSVHCEDRLSNSYPDGIYYVFGPSQNRNDGCYIHSLRFYEYKVAQYRWDASVSPFGLAETCRIDWWNNNTIHLYATEKKYWLQIEGSGNLVAESAVPEHCTKESATKVRCSAAFMSGFVWFTSGGKRVCGAEARQFPPNWNVSPNPPSQCEGIWRNGVYMLTYVRR